jgi:hypothetical protein
MPFKILKRGKEYILKSPTREYKHKTLAKAKAQKKLLEEKDLKQKQKQSQKQVVIVNLNAPSKRRVTAPKPQIQEQVIRMIPSITPFGIQEQMQQARPLQTGLLEDDRIGRLEKSIQELREPLLVKQEELLIRNAPKLDSQLFPESNPFRLRPEDIIVMGQPEVDPRIFEPRFPREGITRQLTIDSVFDNASIGQLIQGDYGTTTRGDRTEPTARQRRAIERWKAQNPK